MSLYQNAEYIFKLDEDIYIPKDYFSDMLEAYEKIRGEVPAYIGYICPMLPLGFYGMHDFLKAKCCLDEYEELFGVHKIGGTVVNPVFREHKGVDEFIWKRIGIFDECAMQYKKNGFSYKVCETRTGIAAIMFARELWDELGWLDKGHGYGVGEGGDEEQITSYCMLHFRLIFCVRHILVGHFSFGGSEPAMEKFRADNPEIFYLKEV